MLNLDLYSIFGVRFETARYKHLQEILLAFPNLSKSRRTPHSHLWKHLVTFQLGVLSGKLTHAARRLCGNPAYYCQNNIKPSTLEFYETGL